MKISEQFAKSSTAFIAGTFSGFCYGAASAGIGAAIAKEFEGDQELTAHINITNIMVSAYIGCTIVKGVFGLILSFLAKVRARYLEEDVLTYELLKALGDVLLLSLGGTVGALIYSQSVGVTALSVGLGAMVLHAGVRADKLFRWTLSKRPSEFEQEASQLLDEQYQYQARNSSANSGGPSARV